MLWCGSRLDRFKGTINKFSPAQAALATLGCRFALVRLAFHDRLVRHFSVFFLFFYFFILED